MFLSRHLLLTNGNCSHAASPAKVLWHFEVFRFLFSNKTRLIRRPALWFMLVMVFLSTHFVISDQNKRADFPLIFAVIYKFLCVLAWLQFLLFLTLTQWAKSPKKQSIRVYLKILTKSSDIEKYRTCTIVFTWIWLLIITTHNPFSSNFFQLYCKHST